MHECPIPDSAMHDDDAVEMLRVWTADQTMYCAMKIGMYQETKKVSEEAIWGAILADVARQYRLRCNKATRAGIPTPWPSFGSTSSRNSAPPPPCPATVRHGNITNAAHHHRHHKAAPRQPCVPSSHARPSSASSRASRHPPFPQRAPSRTRAISSVVRLITAPTIRYSPGASLLPDAAISHATASGVKPPKIVVPRL